MTAMGLLRYSAKSVRARLASRTGPISPRMRACPRRGPPDRCVWPQETTSIPLPWASWGTSPQERRQVCSLFIRSVSSKFSSSGIVCHFAIPGHQADKCLLLLKLHGSVGWSRCSIRVVGDTCSIPLPHSQPLRQCNSRLGIGRRAPIAAATHGLCLSLQSRTNSMATNPFSRYGIALNRFCGVRAK